MFSLFGEKSFLVQINHLTEDLKRDLTHNVRRFHRLLKWFSEAQILCPNISNDKKSYACSLICASRRFYGIMFLRCLRIKFIIWIKIVPLISICTLKLKVRSSYLEKKLARRIKLQKLRSQGIIALERLTLELIK